MIKEKKCMQLNNKHSEKHLHFTERRRRNEQKNIKRFVDCRVQASIFIMFCNKLFRPKQQLNFYSKLKSCGGWLFTNLVTSEENWSHTGNPAYMHNFPISVRENHNQAAPNYASVSFCWLCCSHYRISANLIKLYSHLTVTKKRSCTKNRDKAQLEVAAILVLDSCRVHPACYLTDPFWETCSNRFLAQFRSQHTCHC